MIEYADVNSGDILRIVGAGAPGWAEVGDLVRVLQRTEHGVQVEDRHGDPMEFLFNCGAARLEPTEWKDDFTGGASELPGVPFAREAEKVADEVREALRVAKEACDGYPRSDGGCPPS